METPCFCFLFPMSIVAPEYIYSMCYLSSQSKTTAPPWQNKHDLFILHYKLAVWHTHQALLSPHRFPVFFFFFWRQDILTYMVWTEFVHAMHSFFFKEITHRKQVSLSLTRENSHQNNSCSLELSKHRYNTKKTLGNACTSRINRNLFKALPGL